MDAIFDPGRPPLARIDAYLARERAEFRRPIARYLDRVVGHVRASLETARGAGEPRPDVDPAIAAVALIAVVEGGFVLARTRGEPERLAQATAGARLFRRALLRGGGTVSGPAASPVPPGGDPEAGR